MESHGQGSRFQGRKRRTVKAAAEADRAKVEPEKSVAV